MSVFDSKTYCDHFKQVATGHVRRAIEVGGISEHRGNEILLAWIAGWASGQMHQLTVFQPWTQEHTRRCFDLARLVYETQSETS